jgi:23S rRNA (adenine2503-C2)-methyltransferase
MSFPLTRISGSGSNACGGEGMERKNFFGLSRSALQILLEETQSKHPGPGKSENRASRIFKSFYRNSGRLFPEVPGLAIDVGHFLSETLDVQIPLRIVEASFSSHDGSVKFILELLADGALIESVLIPERGRLTQCLSTQVGCGQGCRFCQTGRMGLKRNLTTAEIVGQVVLLEEWRKTATGNAVATEFYPRIQNLVFMGMGEPLDNTENVIEAVKIFTDNHGLNFSPIKITVSTVGIVPGMRRLLQETSASLALSLHSPFEDQRSRVMPVNDRFPLTFVLDTLRELAHTRREGFMIQYTLIRGVNDTVEHAEALTEVLKGLKVKVNLIPLNEHEGTSYRRPDLGKVFVFQENLKKKGFVATVRLSKGRDIEAACGQLIKQKEKQLSGP